MSSCDGAIRCRWSCKPALLARYHLQEDWACILVAVSFWQFDLVLSFEYFFRDAWHYQLDRAQVVTDRVDVKHATTHHFRAWISKRREYKSWAVTQANLIVENQRLEMLCFAWSVCNTNPFNSTEHIDNRWLAHIRKPDSTNHQSLLRRSFQINWLRVVL